MSSNNPKRVLVTGANKGIGLAITTAILERDGTAVLLGSRDRGRGEAARDGLLAEHPEWADRVEVLPIDVGDDASVQAAATLVAERFGKPALYGVVNNAGLGTSSDGLAGVLNVNVRGPQRVCAAFVDLLDPEHGRIANVSSAAGPNFVATCSPERQTWFTHGASWTDVVGVMDECLNLERESADFSAHGLGDGGPYGMSKAFLNVFTMHLAASHPNLGINACTPGFIETDMTRPYADAQGITPQQMGMKPTSAGTVSTLHLLFGKVGGSGWYFGSDAVRSPLDRYRSPGDPPYTGE